MSARRRELARGRADLETIHILRDNLGRADAMVCATEHQLERYIWRAEGEENADDDEDRPLDHLGHLLAAAKESVRGTASHAPRKAAVAAPMRSAVA